MDPNFVFLIYNSFNFLHGFGHFLYHSYCIQSSYTEISQQTPQHEAVPFFVSGQKMLEPRRPTQHPTSTTQVVIKHAILARKRKRHDLLEFKRKAKLALPAIEEIDKSMMY